MEQEKFKISIIDFLPNTKKVKVGKYEDGTPAYLGDVVKHGEDNWFIVYRYGNVLIKQIGMWAMLGLDGFKNGDFSRVEKTNIIGAGNDWLVIGYIDEPMYEKLKPLLKLNK